MNLASALFAPLLLMISAVSGGDDESAVEPSVPDEAAGLYPEETATQNAPDWPLGVIRSYGPQTAAQVHIEQRMTIRVAPRGGDVVVPSPPRPIGPRFSERKIGKCLPSNSIVGVEPNGPSNLILFLRDRRIINAELERICHSRAFYSGFYISRSQDGMLCVDRDTLLSRSGSSCKLTRLRQLVAQER